MYVISMDGLNADAGTKVNDWNYPVTRRERRAHFLRDLVQRRRCHCSPSKCNRFPYGNSDGCFVRLQRICSTFIAIDGAEEKKWSVTQPFCCVPRWRRTAHRVFLLAKWMPCVD